MNQFESFLYSLKKNTDVQKEGPRNLSERNVEKRAGTEKESAFGKSIESSSIKTLPKPKNE